MVYLCSRSWHLPNKPDPLRMGEVWFFNLWRYRQWPYLVLQPNDVLHLFDRLSGEIKWKVTVSRVERFSYQSLKGAGDEMDIRMPSPVDRSQAHFAKAPKVGYGLLFECRPIAGLSRPRPKNRVLPRLGWIRDQRELAHWI